MRCFLISSLIVVASHSALADRKIDPAATAQLERGEEKFRQKDYAGAIAAFDAGYAIDAQPIFLYDKAQAQRLAGDCRAAIATYKAFLSTDPPANEAARARKNIESCEATLPPATQPPRPPEPAIDSEPSPIEAPTPTRAEPALAIQEQRGYWSDRLGVTLVTAGVVGLGLSAGFAVAARSAAADSALVTDVNQWRAAQQSWNRDRLIAGIAFGGGTALVVSGLLRLSLRDRGVSVTPLAGSPGNGAVLSLGGVW